LPYSFLSFLKYLEPKINGWLRTQVRSTGAPRCFARQVFDKAFLVRLRFLEARLVCSSPQETTTGMLSSVHVKFWDI